MNTLQATIDMLSRSRGLKPNESTAYSAIITLLGIVTLVGIGAGVHSLVVGHEHTFGVSREVPWGILIGAYVFFVVTSTGLCIVSSIGHVFGFKNFAPIAKRAVFLSIVTILAGFLVIAFEIENTWRMPVGNVVGANLTSNIWWMGTLYGAYLVFMILEFFMLLKNSHKSAMAFGLAGLLTGIAAHSNLGAVFGLLNGREFWHGPYMPIYFIASAAMSGCVAIIFFTYLAYLSNGWQMNENMKKSMESVAKLGALLMAIILFFTCWKVIAGITGHPPGKYETMELLLTGKYKLNFFGGEIMLGMVLPFIIIMLVRGRNMTALFIASVPAIIGIFIMRYDLVIVGQLVPHYHGMGLVDYPEYFSYSPTLHENLVVAGGIALCVMLFLLGEKLFRGHVAEEH
jgi:molybdopterin-containing oxidoreductase family membrane subunit